MAALCSHYSTDTHSSFLTPAVEKLGHCHWYETLLSPLNKDWIFSELSLEASGSLMCLWSKAHISDCVAQSGWISSSSNKMSAEQSKQGRNCSVGVISLCFFTSWQSTETVSQAPCVWCVSLIEEIFLMVYSKNQGFLFWRQSIRTEAKSLLSSILYQCSTVGEENTNSSFEM